MSNDPNQNVPQYPPSYPPQQPSYPPPPPSYSPAPGGPQYAPPPQGYGYGYPAPPMAPATSGWAIASLICGIIGFSILAIIFGYIGRNEIKNSGGRLTGDGLALAGLIIGWIELALGILLFALIIISIIATSASSTSY